MGFITKYKEKKRLGKLDEMWSEPNPIKLKNLLDLELKSQKLELGVVYLKSLQTDVLEDNPQGALEFLGELGDHALRYEVVRFRMAYLHARMGNHKQALEFLSGLKSASVEPFKRCLEVIKGSFTMTKSMVEITQKYGVHDHFGVIESLVRKYNLKNGVELGVLYGYHLSHLLEACRTLKVSGVDIYSKVVGSGYDDFTEADFDKVCEETQQRLNAFGRYLLIRETTIDGAKKIMDQSLDYAFIDADHRYEAVKEDIKAWQPKVKKGGILAGHDIDQPGWPGVRKAVEEWCGDNGVEFYVEQGFVWWFINK